MTDINLYLQQKFLILNCGFNSSRSFPLVQDEVTRVKSEFWWKGLPDVIKKAFGNIQTEYYEMPLQNLI